MPSMYSCLMNGCNVEIIKLCWKLRVYLLCSEPEIYLSQTGVLNSG